MALHLQIEDLSAPAPPRRLTLDVGLITIGREAGNLVHLDDAAHTISRRHAAIRNGPTAEVMDLGSRNATYLNDHRLDPRQGYPLRTGDVLRLGPFRVTVQHDPPTAHRPTAHGTAEPDTYRAPSPDAPREELARAVRELKLLNELAVEIGASRDVDAVMDRVVRRSLDALGAEQGLITLGVNTDGGEIAHRTMVRTGDEFDLDRTLEAWMLQHRAPFRLNAPREHFAFRAVRWKTTLRNLLCVPLVVRGTITGLLTLYNKHAPGGFTEGDEQLASIIAAQSAHIIDNARLFVEEQELVRMQQEMAVALEIQTNLLPSESPAIPGYDVAGCSLSAQTVGGDHLDYIPLDDGRWALCVGDVSGKGLPAALVMANLQATLRAQTLWAASVAACLEGTNHLLYQSTNRRTFVTLFYGVLDPTTHVFRYANAGHNRPLVVRADGTTALTAAGLPLGAVRRVDYTEHELTLAPDETLLIFSDGVVEARAEDGALFEDAPLEALVARHHGAPAQQLVDAVVAAVRAHAGGAPQADDMTLLALRRLP